MTWLLLIVDAAILFFWLGLVAHRRLDRLRCRWHGRVALSQRGTAARTTSRARR